MSRCWNNGRKASEPSSSCQAQLHILQLLHLAVSGAQCSREHVDWNTKTDVHPARAAKCGLQLSVHHDWLRDVHLPDAVKIDECRYLVALWHYTPEHWELTEYKKMRCAWMIVHRIRHDLSALSTQ